MMISKFSKFSLSRQLPCMKRQQMLVGHQKREFISRIMNWFFKPQIATYNKSGRAVVMNESTIELEDTTDSANINVSLSIEKNYFPIYDEKSEVIIKNYGSCLSIYDFPGITIRDTRGQKGFRSAIVGRSYSGIIEHIPKPIQDKIDKKYKNKVFENDNDRPYYAIGDRVWGLSPVAFGQQWADYSPVYYHTLRFAPNNIPLHYLGMLPISTLTFFNCLHDAGVKNFSNLRGRTILFLGSGNKSMLNIGIPLLSTLGVRSISVVTSSKRHENVLINDMGLDKNNILHYEDDYITKLGNFDLIIDSLSTNLEQINYNLQLGGKHSSYVVMHTPIPQIIATSESQFKGFREANKWMREVAQNAININKIKVSFGIIPKTQNLYLHDWGKMIMDSEKAWPIIIDKMYSLDNIQHALNYAFDNDDHILGENIGVLINKEGNFKCQDMTKKWYPVELDDIEPYQTEKRQKVLTKEQNQTQIESENQTENTIELENKIEKDASSEIEDTKEKQKHIQKN